MKMSMLGLNCQGKNLELFPLNERKGNSSTGITVILCRVINQSVPGTKCTDKPNAGRCS